jgi:mono/diheme cytochrome c family protein
MGDQGGIMKRTNRTRSTHVFVSLLGAAIAAGTAIACSGATPDLPDDPNPLRTAAKPPPPISGGTLHVTPEGLAIAADSDRDVVWLVDLATQAIRKVALQPGDEPGRVAVDGAGRAHVALRGAGAIASIDLATGKVVARAPVCAAPRGLAHEPATDRLHVACAGGELISLDPATLTAVRTLRVDRDLRDVVVRADGGLLVTRFRSAEWLDLDADGDVVSRRAPSATDPFTGMETPAAVAWRALPTAQGTFLVHQRGTASAVQVSSPGGYGSDGSGDPCGNGGGGIVTVAITQVDADPTDLKAVGGSIPGAALPVDLAADGAGNLAIASAGTSSVFIIDAAAITGDASGCQSTREVRTSGQPVAVASWQGRFVAQDREPAALSILDGTKFTRIALPGESVADSGHDLFHRAASATTRLACASCHPEGHDDGRVWAFETIGKRRTQDLGGGVLDTAPLHWNGDLTDLGAVMHEVFEHRMGGATQGPRHVEAFAGWLQSIPAHRAAPLGSAAQIAHGKEIFARADVACAKCHGGARLTNNENADVGTGRAFQVPTLVGIAARAPFMHDGCAPTLRSRFDPAAAACNGGDQHGHTSQLSPAEIDDLVAYLESL